MYIYRWRHQSPVKRADKRVQNLDTALLAGKLMIRSELSLYGIVTSNFSQHSKDGKDDRIAVLRPDLPKHVNSRISSFC